MELLIPSIIVLVNLAVKKLIDKLGYEVGSAFVLLLVFILSAIAAAIYHFAGNLALWKEIGIIFASQMAIYEIVFKRVIQPILAKFSKTEPSL